MTQSLPSFPDLYQALLRLDTVEECQNFMADLCTPQEIESLQERWKICQLLETENFSYREIHTLTGASLTTISRVGRFLKHEEYQGYKSMIKKFNKETENV